MRKVTVICRAGSRNGLAFYHRIVDELPKRGVVITAAHIVNKRKELLKRVRQTVKSSSDIIVVIGGDGSQTAAVSQMAGKNCTLAVVPAGTGNSFALGLGIKADIDEAIDTIVEGKELRVDVGCIDGEYFANFATIGVTAAAAEATPKPLKRVIGPLAYGVGFLKAFFGREAFDLDVRWSGNDMKLHTHQALIAAGRYYGWAPLTPNADVRTGELAFFSAAGNSTASAIQINAALALGEQTHVANAHYFSAPQIKIRTKPRQPINLDGHAWGKTPATFTVVKDALRVLVPSDFKPTA